MKVIKARYRPRRLDRALDTNCNIYPRWLDSLRGACTVVMDRTRGLFTSAIAALDVPRFGNQKGLELRLPEAPGTGLVSMYDLRGLSVYATWEVFRY